MYGIRKEFVIAAIIAAVAVEVLFRLPDILLFGQRYEATKAEYEGKALAYELAEAQLEKARYDAKAAAYQPALMKAQVDKAQSDATTAQFASDAAKYQEKLAFAQLQKANNEAEASNLQPQMVGAQLDKARYDAKASSYQPDLSSAQLDKTKLEAEAAQFQPGLNRMQLAKLGVDTQAAVATLSVTQKSAALGNTTLDVMNPLTEALIGAVSKALGQPSGQPSGQPQLSGMDRTNNYNDGASAHAKYINAANTRSHGDVQAGVLYGLSILFSQETHGCIGGQGGTSAAFVKACAGILDQLANTITYGPAHPGFVDGWNSR
jgi:hypothetical protein